MLEFADMGEAAKWLAEKIASAGMSVTTACERSGIPRGSFYLLQRKGTAVGPAQLANLAAVLEVTPEEEMALFVAWFRARVASSALSGPFLVAMSVIDKLPAKRRRETYRAMIDAYDDGRGARAAD